MSYSGHECSEIITRHPHPVRFKFFLVGISFLTSAFISPLTYAHPNRFLTAPAAVIHKDNNIINSRDVQIIFVDMQPELIKDSLTVNPKAISVNAAALARVAQLTNIPVTFSIVPIKGEAGRNIPELRQYANVGNTVPRVMAGTFMEPKLVSALANHHRRILVISGYATEVAVLQTALDARKAGYEVYVAVDAVGSRSERTEKAALDQMEMAGAIPTSVLAVAAQLAPDFSKKPGSDVLATFDSLSPP